MAIKVQVRRGSSTQRSLMDGQGNNPAPPDVGELIYTTDDKLLYIGDGTTTGGNLVGGSGGIADGSLTPAKMSFLGTIDETGDNVTRILSKQSDGDYDSVTPSGDVTMAQNGVFTIAADAVTATEIDDNAVTSAGLQSDANTDGNRAVTTDHIRNDAVTSDKLQDSATTDTDRAVTTDHIRDGAITSDKLNASIDFGSI